MGEVNHPGAVTCRAARPSAGAGARRRAQGLRRRQEHPHPAQGPGGVADDHLQLQGRAEVARAPDLPASPATPSSSPTESTDRHETRVSSSRSALLGGPVVARHGCRAGVELRRRWRRPTCRRRPAGASRRRSRRAPAGTTTCSIRGNGDARRGDLVNVLSTRARRWTSTAREASCRRPTTARSCSIAISTQLNSFDQRGSFFGRRLADQARRRVRPQFGGVSAHHRAGRSSSACRSSAPARGSRTCAAGVEASFTKYTSAIVSYNFQWVDFDQTVPGRGALLGGHSHGASVTLQAPAERAAGADRRLRLPARDASRRRDLRRARTPSARRRIPAVRVHAQCSRRAASRGSASRRSSTATTPARRGAIGLRAQHPHGQPSICSTAARSCRRTASAARCRTKRSPAASARAARAPRLHDVVAVVAPRRSADASASCRCARTGSRAASAMRRRRGCASRCSTQAHVKRSTARAACWTATGSDSRSSQPNR